jgi:hypothetical protein
MDKADEAKISAVLGFLESLKERVLETLKHYPDVTTDEIVSESQVFLFNETAERLLEEYNQEYSHVNELVGFNSYRGLQYVSKPSSPDLSESWYATLTSLIPQIDKGIMGLRSKISLLSPHEIQELRVIRDDLQKVLSELPEIYEKNAEEAIREFEKGAFLGSALISGRVIQYVFDQIPGENIKEKIKALEDKGLVEEKGEVPPEYVLKADRKARNYFSHDITAYPDRSEALELVIICKRIFELLKAFKQQ